MRESRSAELSRDLVSAGICFEREVPLSRFTTLGLGGPAEILARPRSVDEVQTIFELTSNHDVPIKVLGAGSNLIVNDSGVAGVVVHTASLDSVSIREDGIVQAGAGCNFPALVRRTASAGWRGLESGVGIPGSLGGVLTMNAGAYKFSVGVHVEEVVAASLTSGKVILPKTSINFRYRSSSFGPELVVVGAKLSLVADSVADIRADMEEYMRFRKQTQPVGVKSAGCIFKNPEGSSAGKLLDDLGLKGFSIGKARISEVHANFIVHEGDSSTDEVLALIEAVREKVQVSAHIELEQEVMTWH